MLVSALLRIAADGEPRPCDVVLILTSDEERGSKLGAKFLVGEHAAIFRGVRYAFSEVGGFTEWIGEKRLYPIQVTEKQRCLIRATVRGRGGHSAATIEGTAAMRLGRLLQSLDKKRLPVHVTSQLRRMMVATADALPTHLRIASRAVLWPRFTNRILAVLKTDTAPLDVLLHNTATPIAVDSGKKTGEVPTEITVDFDGRVLPGQTPADLVHELKTLVGDLADFEVVNEEPAVRAESDLTLYPMLAEIIRRHDPGGIPIPALIPGYTDARHFGQLGIQTYGFTPMRLPKHITLDLIHAPDERVPAEAIVFGTECLVDAIRGYFDLMTKTRTLP
jgi:acetylornithine deacetylase/succinyl-diaminopimelate desuccinylase-like protein